jgi:hypothetical protein
MGLLARNAPMDARHIGERSDAVLRTAIAGHDGRERCHISVDKCHRFSYKPRISLIEGRRREASPGVERVRCPRADLHSAPGPLRATRPAGMTTGLREARWTGTDEGG